MNIWRELSLAIWSIWTRPARSLIMALILAVGVSAVMIATAITTGYAERIEQLAFGDYARSIVVTENFNLLDRFGPPRVADLNRVAAGLGEAISVPVEARAAWRHSRAQAVAGRERIELDVWGVLGDYRREADMELVAGRHLDLAEVNSASRRCLIGASVHADLFRGNPESAVGQRIRLNGAACEIAGIFAPARTITATRFDDAVIAPFTAVARYFETRRHLGPHEATRLTLVLSRDADMTQARSEVDRILRASHGAPLSQPAPFRFVDSAAPIIAVARQRDLVSRLLFAVSAITLTASVIGYAGMALASVEIRRRDIALQMASGALASNIVLQIMLESLLIGLFGGAAGFLAGAVFSQVSGPIFGLPASLALEAALIATGIGALAGMLASVLPARLAGSAPPAVAMRG